MQEKPFDTISIGARQRRRRTLEEQVLAAFKQAVAEDRLAVADHLLRALEVLVPDEGLGSILDDAYILIAEPKGFKC